MQVVTVPGATRCPSGCATCGGGTSRAALTDLRKRQDAKPTKKRGRDRKQSGAGCTETQRMRILLAGGSEPNLEVTLPRKANSWQMCRIHSQPAASPSLSDSAGEEAPCGQVIRCGGRGVGWGNASNLSVPRCLVLHCPQASLEKGEE